MTQGFFQFNNSIIDEIINFTTSPFDLFFMSGAKGSSKSEIIEKVVNELSDENLIFRHFCFENSVIDDFLLNFYDELKNFSLARNISLKKFTTGNFKDKVSHYFKTIYANCLIIVENFEQVEQNVEIVDFLSHLANYSNVKIIIVTRNHDKNLFRFKNIKMKTYKIEQITKDDFKSKLSILTQPVGEDLSEKFYTISGGSELYLNMAIKYCSNAEISIRELVDEYERKSIQTNETFEQFMVYKFFSLIPLTYKNFFNILSVLAHPVSNDFIKEYQLADTDTIEYLSKNFLISKFDNEIYVKDYYKEYIKNTFSIQEKSSIYNKMVEIFENELTKSPKDRLLRLSRESIRKEIESFNKSIPSVNFNNQKNVSYIGISGFQGSPKSSPLSDRLNKIRERRTNLIKRQSSFSIFKKQNEEEQKKQQQEENKNAIIDLINSAREFESQYRYKNAIEDLIRALDIDFEDEFEIELCMLIAKNYEFLNEYITAQTYYKQALAKADETNDLRKCEILYAIAMTNKNSYKIEEAKEQFIEIEFSDEYSDKYRALASIEIGQIEEANSNLDEAVRHYENAISFSIGKYKDLTCSSYYRLALLYDENGDTEEAIEYYKKNYTTSSQKVENEYYSISLTNLALIYKEQSRYDEAGEFLKLALAFDSENNDLENMYFSQKELAKLYAITDKTLAPVYFKEAIETAKKLKDSFKIALIYFEAGDFYYENMEDEKALSFFLNAKKILGNRNDENISRINSRIQDIKVRLNKAVYNVIVEKFK